MTPDVESYVAVANGARNAAQVLGVRFEYRDGDAVFHEMVRGGEPGGAAANDDDMSGFGFCVFFNHLRDIL